MTNIFSNVTIKYYKPKFDALEWTDPEEFYQEKTIKSASNLNQYCGEEQEFGIYIVSKNISNLLAGSVADIKYLTSLHLESCKIKELQPGAFKNLPALKNLNLSNNLIKNINAGIFLHVPLLEQIKLINNEISHIHSDAFKGLNKLRIVNLEKNKLDEFDVEWFKDCCHIYWLNMNKNQLKHLPPNVFHLEPYPDHENKTAIAAIDIRNNQIETIDPDFLPDLGELCRIDLGGNKIKKVEHGTFRKVQLIMDAMFNDNGLAEFDDTTIVCMVLDLSNNNLRRLPEGLQVGMELKTEGNPNLISDDGSS